MYEAIARTRDARTPRPGAAAMARIADVARLPGVSTATVDRVLNRRPGVRAATVQRVLKAAGELGYMHRGERMPAQAPKPMRLAFLLPAGTNRFLGMLGRLGRRDRRTSSRRSTCARRVEYHRELQARAAGRSVCGASARDADGIAFMALEHPAVREAVEHAGRARRAGRDADLRHRRTHARAAYVGLDNRSAGRTAGYLIARFIGRAAGQGRDDRRQPELPRP